MDNMSPVPVGIDHDGEYELMSSCYFSITDNYKLGRFSLGYGLNYARNSWDLRNEGVYDVSSSLREPIKKTSNSLGATINGYYQLGECFHVGVIYRPSILRVHPKTSFQYEHLISLDFAWKFKLRK